MKSYIALIVLILFVGVSPSTFAATVDPATTTTTAVQGSSLLLSDVAVQDLNTFTLKFNQPINSDSVRIRVVNQGNNETVRVVAIDPVATDASSVTVKTTTPLVTGGVYTLTIIDVASTSGTTIKAGVDSIREFTVPTSLAGATLNAPPNPNAVMATGNSMPPPDFTTLNNTGTQPPVTSVTPPVTATGASPEKTAEALPATGMEMIVLIGIAGILATVIFLRKRA